MNFTSMLDVVLVHPFIWQSTLWLTVGIVVSRLFARRPAHAHATLFAALSGAVVSPILGMCSGSLGIALLPQRTVVLAPDLAQLSRALLAPWYYSTDVALFLMGGLVSVFYAIRFARSMVLARSVLRDSTPVLDANAISALRIANSHHRNVVLREHDDIRTPSIWCWSRPAVILLPPEISLRMSTESLTAVFRHELAHLSRQDHFIWALTGALVSLIAWNPLAWYVRRQLRLLSEQACDVAAAATVAARANYAETLLQLAVNARARYGLPVVSSEDGLAIRIQKLLNGQETPTQVGRAFFYSVAICVLAFVASLAPLQRAQGIEFTLPGELHATRFVPNSSDNPNESVTSLETLDIDGENLFVGRIENLEHGTSTEPIGHAIFISDGTEGPAELDPMELLPDSPETIWIEKE